MLWIEFILCSSLLVFFAYNLCKEGVVISEKTSLEKGLIGMLFLAAATSAPEIITASSAVRVLGNISLGYGDIMGSVMVNLMIFPFLDFYRGKGRILGEASGGNLRTGEAALAASAVLLVSVLARGAGWAIPVLGGRFGLENLVILGTYFWAVTVFRSGEKRTPEIYPKTESFVRIWAKFGVFLVAVMFLSLWLASIGDRIGASTGMSGTFTGAFLLGIITSLPEIIVTFAALKVGTADMAIGNILGSNLFDLCVIPVLDLLVPGPMLGMLGAPGAAAAGAVAVLSLITVAGMKVKGPAGGRVGPDSALIFAVGFAGFVILYFLK